MLGLFKSKIDTPIQLTAEVDINAPAAEVFACLDMFEAENRYTLQGMTVTRDTSQERAILLEDPRVPDMVFNMVETRRKPGRVIEICTVMPKGEAAGNMVWGVSAYTVEPLDEETCRVSTENGFQMHPLTEKEWANETAMLSIAVHDDLSRLKALIEEGPDAADHAGALDEFFEMLEELPCANEG